MVTSAERSTRIPLYSCAAAALFPDTAAGAQELAALQWSSRVRFRETVERMHADGVRHFIEVGPSAHLTAFVNDVLAGKERCALATNVRRRNGVEQFLTVLAELYASGKPLALGRLFAGRECARPGAAAPRDGKTIGVLLDNTMPMLRFSADERAELRRLASGASAERARSAAGAPQTGGPQPASSSDPTSAERAFADEDSAIVEVPEAAVAAERDHVMADYFELMRGFLAQQAVVAERLTPAPIETSVSAGPDTAPLLEQIVEHDTARVVARCPLSLADNFLRSHVLSGPVSEVDPELSGLACVPLMVSLEVMAEACAVLAGTRSDAAIIVLRCLPR
jgi:acyl transferase domain-containing protein